MQGSFTGVATSVTHVSFADWRVSAWIVMAMLLPTVQGCSMTSAEPAQTISKLEVTPADIPSDIPPVDQPQTDTAIESSPAALISTSPEFCDEPPIIMLPAPSPPLFMETGLASWYGAKHHGKRTASGEVFDQNKFTAAHRTLPWGSIVKVTNLANRQSVELRINDRGPYGRGRIIDVSRAAARVLGMTRSGVARVRVELISSPEAAQDFTATK